MSLLNPFWRESVLDTLAQTGVCCVDDGGTHSSFKGAETYKRNQRRAANKAKYRQSHNKYYGDDNETDAEVSVL